MEFIYNGPMVTGLDREEFEKYISSMYPDLEVVDVAYAYADWFGAISVVTTERMKGGVSVGSYEQKGALFTQRYRKVIDWVEATPPKSAPTNKKTHPTIVCLCGSTRFWKTFQKASLQETLAGKIVLSIGAASGTDEDHFGNLPPDEYHRIKDDLDLLHLQKIDLADEVLILDVDGYIGESTQRELNYAVFTGKQVRYWSAEGGA